MLAMVAENTVQSQAPERRVAITPDIVARYRALGATVMIEAGAGRAAGFSDQAYQEKGATLTTRKEALAKANIIVSVGVLDHASLKQVQGATLVSFVFAEQRAQWLADADKQQCSVYGIERLPRISRAQSMDALSSQATCIGYAAVLLGTQHLGRFLPMLTTAAGTVRPATVLVCGAGVAGLSAIATAKRLGAKVRALDVRPAAREQVESLGAVFVDSAVSAEGSGGYARALTEQEKQAQSTLMASEVAASDVVITCAGVPGKAPPLLITKQMVESMKEGSVLVDTMAKPGGNGNGNSSGNCELTQPDNIITHANTTIIGDTQLASRVCEHASMLYSKNIFSFLSPCIKEGVFTVPLDDEIYRACLVAPETKSAP